MEKKKSILIRIYLSCFIILIGSCKSGSEKREVVTESMINSSQVTLERVNQHKLVLDSVTSSFTYDIQNISYDGRNCIAILNSLVDKIQIYDFESGMMIESINYDLEGDNGVGQSPRAFYIQNTDSIFIFEIWSGVVSLINSDSKVINRFDLAPNGLNDGKAAPQGSTQRPLKVIDGKIYMAGLLLPWKGLELNENQFIQMELGSKKLKYFIERPELYNEHNWGNNVMFYLNYDYNSNSKEFIFSFNNYQEIVVTDQNGNNRRTFPTLSRYFDKVVPYENRFSYNWKKDKMTEYNYLNPRYWQVIYDKYRNVTYRMALRPYSEEDFRIGVRSMKVSIIILNDTYQKIGEFDVDRSKYDHRMTFVSEEGLHLLNISEFKNNEDLLVFDIFKISDLQK